MDRERTIALLEMEILRKKGMAELCGDPYASQHLEVAGAIAAALEAYEREERT